MIRRTMLRLVLASASIVASVSFAQAPPMPTWQTAAGGRMEFEVASVRSSKPGTTMYGSSVSLDGLDGPPTGNLFRANAPLHAYLLFAYKISDPVQARNIFDKLPDWAKAPQFFAIDARADGTPTRDQMRLMMQALLADRFKLVIHREMQPREQYLIVLDKPGKQGPHLQRHLADKPCTNNPNTSPTIEAPGVGGDAPRYCGLVIWRAEGLEHLRMTDVTMAQIANYLSGASMRGGTLLPHSGVDGTELAGRFDLDLQFVPEVGANPDPDIDGPTFMEALKKQLGLKLVERKGMVEVLAIDHLEKPTDNI